MRPRRARCIFLCRLLLELLPRRCWRFEKARGTAAAASFATSAAVSAAGSAVFFVACALLRGRALGADVALLLAVPPRPPVPEEREGAVAAQLVLIGSFGIGLVIKRRPAGQAIDPRNALVIYGRRIKPVRFLTS